jgi:kynurenine 3-monooxygenase
MNNAKEFSVAGGGPVGALLAIVLARHGYQVDLFEGRPDSRQTNIYQGKSINIALSDRGWHSLDRIGVGPAVKDEAIPMFRRSIHGRDGSLTYQPYGKEDQAIWSVSRGRINEHLLDLAEAEAGVHTFFEHKLIDVDFETAAGTFQFSYSQSYMPQCYIELTIPANADGSHQFEKNALHIWPRKHFMLIALPNPDGSFTCTLFLNYSGEPSFESLTDRKTVEHFFESEFPDAMDLLDSPVDTFMQRTPAPLFLVHVFPWSFNNKVALIGDAAHAIVPFYGQGMNCGFEDCAELNALIDENDRDWSRIFPAYETRRKPNADAIAELSKRNFVEMSDLSGDPMFQLRKKIEAKFHEAHPDLWTPLYSMVTFSPDVPYAKALSLGDEQNKVMERIMRMPGIEKDWQEQKIMDEMYALVVNGFGTEL